MKIHPAKTPSVLHARHEQRSHRPDAEALTQRPPLVFGDDDGDATAAWLRHIDAGRIKVR